MSSENINVHGDSDPTSSVSWSITVANRKELRTDPWCSPSTTLNSSVTATAHLTTVLLLSCKVHVSYYSNISLCRSRRPWRTIIPLSLPCHWLSRDRRWKWKEWWLVEDRSAFSVLLHLVARTHNISTFLLVTMSTNFASRVINPPLKVHTFRLMVCCIHLSFRCWTCIPFVVHLQPTVTE